MVFDFRHAHLTPLLDPLGTLVHDACGRDVEHVFVDGRQVVAERRRRMVGCGAHSRRRATCRAKRCGRGLAAELGAVEAHRVTKETAIACADLDAIVTTLRKAIDASRTTLRLDDASYGLPHRRRRGGGARARREVDARLGGINHRGAGTGQWLERHRRLLVQDDLSRGEPKAPQGLTQGFGVKAQMLAPVVRDGRLDGWVSVHEAKSTRAWTEADQAAAMRAAEQVLQALES